MRSWVVPTVGGALALIVLGFAWWRPSPDTGGAPPSGQTAELDALKAEVQQLRGRVAELSQRQASDQAPRPPAGLPEGVAAHLAAAAAQQQPQQAEATAPAGPTAPMTEEEERADQLRYVQYLDDRLASSPSEDETAAALRASVDEVLGDASSVLDLQCAEELCRMKTRHADKEAYSAFVISAFQHRPRIWDGPATFVVLEEPDEHGSPLVAGIYLGRGEALPSPEPAR